MGEKPFGKVRSHTTRGGNVLVAKCTNPLCSAPFHRLGEGTLFRLETDPRGWRSTYRTPEYFWLCKNCSNVMTLCIAENGVATCALPAIEPRRTSRALHRVFRHDGLWLYSVNFTHVQGEDEAA